MLESLTFLLPVTHNETFICSNCLFVGSTQYGLDTHVCVVKKERPIEYVVGNQFLMDSKKKETIPRWLLIFDSELINFSSNENEYKSLKNDLISEIKEMNKELNPNHYQWKNESLKEQYYVLRELYYLNSDTNISNEIINCDNFENIQKKIEEDFRGPLKFKSINLKIMEYVQFYFNHIIEKSKMSNKMNEFKTTIKSVMLQERMGYCLVELDTREIKPTIKKTGNHIYSVFKSQGLNDNSFLSCFQQMIKDCMYVRSLEVKNKIQDIMDEYKKTLKECEEMDFLVFGRLNEKICSLMGKVFKGKDFNKLSSKELHDYDYIESRLKEIYKREPGRREKKNRN